jgi:uncharacterized membrane protein
MPKKSNDKTKHVKKDDSESKLLAFIGVLPIIIGYVLVVLTRKEDKYAMYYAKQGLILFIAFVIAWAACGMLRWIPQIGDILGFIVEAIAIILLVIGIVYSLSGEEKEIPIIGPFAKKL